MMPAEHPVLHHDRDTRVVCAVLAAQVAALRDRLESGSTVDLLWRTADALSQVLEQLTASASTSRPSSEPADIGTTIAELSRSFNDVAFVHAQHHDLACQIANGVVIALERLSAADASAENHLSPDDLTALYVSEDQRAVHNAVAARFAAPSPSAACEANRAGRK